MQMDTYFWGFMVFLMVKYFPKLLFFVCLSSWYLSGRLKKTYFIFLPIILFLIKILFLPSIPSVLITFFGVLCTLGLGIFNTHLTLVLTLMSMGSLLNIFVMAMNDNKMPVLDSGFDASIYILMDHSTKFNILGDWIPLIGSIISIGDIVVVVGSFVLLFEFIRIRQKKRTVRGGRSRLFKLRELQIIF